CSGNGPPAGSITMRPSSIWILQCKIKWILQGSSLDAYWHHRNQEHAMTIHTPPPYAKARNPKRARYDEETINAILDAGLVGHVGFIADGRPMVIPMAYARSGATIYLHGSSKARIVAMHQ